jgi:hypothetical protein
MTEAKEATHFYPVMVYFRFDESFYSVSQFVLVALDAVSLIHTALDQEQYGWLARSSAIRQLDRSAYLLIDTMITTFREGDGKDQPPTDKAEKMWRRRFERACQRLEEAGIASNCSPDAARHYIDLRTKWQPFINSLAPAMGLRAHEIDPAVVQS